MRLIVTESPIRARTIWSALGNPEENVVVPLDADFVALKPKVPTDEQNGFVPTWGVTNERAFKNVTRQARNADQIILTQDDDWLVATTEDLLRCAGVTAPIKRVLFSEFTAEHIKTTIARDVSIRKDAVQRTWRRLTADHIAGDAVSKVLRKSYGIDWTPSLSELRTLHRIGNAAYLDSGFDPLGFPLDAPKTYRAPTILGAIVRLQTYGHPADTANQILDLIAYGLLALGSESSIHRVRQWCDRNCTVVPTALLDPSRLLMPTDPTFDLQKIQPAYRTTYADVWTHAILMFAPSFRTKALREPTPYRGETARFLSDDLQDVKVLGKLREIGLIFGWSYTQLTDTGLLVDAMLRSTFPVLYCEDFLVGALAGLDDLTVSRENAIGAVKAATLVCRDADVAISTLCPVCRGQLKPILNQKRLRLSCQDPSCQKVWPAQRDGSALRPIIGHDAPRWCERDGVVLHEISIDPNTQATKQRCKTCNQTKQY